MFESLAESMTSLLCDLSLEKATGNMEDKLKRKQLSNEIRKQITRYENEILPGLDGAEQFDFAGVNQYITKHLFDKIAACFNLPQRYQRECARRDLTEAVYDEAGADTIARKKAVSCYLQTFLQIVEAHYLEKIEDRTWFLAGKAVDDAMDQVQKYLKKTENTIVDAVRYQGSFAEYIDGIKPESDNINAFHYRNELLKFRGREAELKMLREFIESDKELSWMKRLR